MTRALRVQYPGSAPALLDIDDAIAASSLAEVVSTRLMTAEQKMLGTRATLRLSGGGVARVFHPGVSVREALEAFDSSEILIEISVRAIGGGH